MTFLAATQRRILAGSMLLVVCGMPAAAQEQRRSFYTPPAAGTFHAVSAEHGMVVAQEKIAARIGADMLKRGGNAVDAAVATGFAMAVTYPRAGNIGGGGFMVIHRPSATRTSPSTIARPRRRRPRARFFSEPTASPIPQSRAIPRSASACPAPSPAWRWRWKNMARANSRWPNCCGPRSSSRATALPSPTTAPIRCRTGKAARALAGVGEDLFPRRRHIAARRRQADSDRPRRDAGGHRRTGPTRLLPGRGRGQAGGGGRAPAAS